MRRRWLAVVTADGTVPAGNPAEHGDVVRTGVGSTPASAPC